MGKHKQRRDRKDIKHASREASRQASARERSLTIAARRELEAGDGRKSETESVEDVEGSGT